MKKWIVVLLVLIVSSNVYAYRVGFGDFGARIELGQMLDYGSSKYNQSDIPHDYIYSDIFIFYDFRWGVNHRIYYGFRTWALRSDFLSDRPFREIYTGGYKIQYGMIYLDLKHFCNHAVYSTGNKEYWMDNKWGEQMTTISIGIEFK